MSFFTVRENRLENVLSTYGDSSVIVVGKLVGDHCTIFI